MIVGLCLYAATFSPAGHLLNACAQAHERLEAAKISAEVRYGQGSDSPTTRLELSYRRPGSARLDFLGAPSGQPVKSLFVADDTVISYDPRAKQYVEDDRVKGDDLATSIARMDPGVDEFLCSMSLADGVAKSIGALGQLNGWTVAWAGPSFELRLKTPEVDVQLTINRATSLLERRRISSSGASNSWSLRYAAAGETAFSPPSGSYRVAVIDPVILPPSCDSAATRKVLNRMFAAYDRPKSMGYTLTEAGGTTTVRVLGKGVRQTDSVADWAYDGESGKIVHAAGDSVYEGKATLGEFVEAVATLGTRVEPGLRSLMRGLNPYRVILGHKYHVRSVGSIRLEGARCAVLAARSQIASISLVVRESDGLVLSVVTEPYDPGGTKMPGSDKRYQYFTPKPAEMSPENPGGLTEKPIASIVPKPR